MSNTQDFERQGERIEKVLDGMGLVRCIDIDDDVGTFGNYADKFVTAVMYHYTYDVERLVVRGGKRKKAAVKTTIQSCDTKFPNN